MRKLLIPTMILMAATAFGQAKPPDPFDITAATAAVGDIVPTVAGVGELEAKVKTALDSGDCKAALPLLEKFAEQTNRLANLISRGLQPYYDAPADKRRAFTGINALVPIENTANGYKAKRNRAVVMQAECQAKLGDNKGAAASFYKALDLINISETEWWDRARKGLFAIIGLAEQYK